MSKYRDDLRRRALTRAAAIQQGWVCFYCEKPIADIGDIPNAGALVYADRKVGGRRVLLGLSPYTGDHVIAQSQGGGHTHENIVACCMPCNSWKNNRPVDVFLRELAHWISTYRSELEALGYWRI